MAARRFSNRRKEEAFEVELEDGTILKLVARELMGDDREEYITFQAGRMKLDKRGRPVGMGDAKGVSLKLMSLGLYDASTLARITEEQLESWKLTGRVQGDICAILIQMSGLGDDAEEDAKKP